MYIHSGWKLSVIINFWEMGKYKAVKKAIVLGDTGTIVFFYEKIISLHGSEV